MVEERRITVLKVFVVFRSEISVLNGYYYLSGRFAVSSNGRQEVSEGLHRWERFLRHKQHQHLLAQVNDMHSAIDQLTSKRGYYSE